jgi:serine/threonine protein kinase/outer membrane protein assembly factor BamB
MGEGLAALAAGVRVGGYLLEEQVGAGGMAVVFRARDERLRRLVALKVLGPGLAADEDFRQRFIRESRAAAAVEDPHIIPVHEAGQADGVLFIAMRYVSGGDVRTLLRRAGPLSPDRAAAIISPVAAALDSAHAAGLVHRDVKPANMLLDARPGRPEHVYLSDFGLSKGTLSVGLTGTGHFLGTPGYSAPEQIQGRPVDGRADQYALACTAFELLCGTAVFQRDEVLAMMYAHLSEPPPPLASRRPGTPAAADAVLARALAKDPAGRYASCQEFADALRGAFRLAAYHAAYEPSPPPDHRLPAITHGNGLAATRNGLPADPMTQSAGLRDPRHPATPGHPEEVTGSWPETQHRARHARAQNDQAHPVPPSQNQGREPEAARGTEGPQGAARKPAVTRRTILGLTAAAATAGLAAAAWDLTRHTTPPRHTPTRPAGTQPGGTPIWTRPIPNGGIGWGPMFTDNVVYVGDTGTSSSLYALNADNGRIIWRHPGTAGQLGVSSIATTGNSIYTLTCTGSWPINYGVAAYNARTGALLWEMPPTITGSQFGTGAVYGPTVDGNTLYVVDGNGKLYALNIANGRVLWTFPTGGAPGGLAASGGTVYLASQNDSGSESSPSEIYAVRSGRLIWRTPSRGTITEGPVIIGDLVYVIADTGGVSALHINSGDEAWNFGAAPGSWSFRAQSSQTGAWIVGGIVYTDDGVGNLHALRASDGTEIWRAPTSHVKFGVATYKDAVYISNGFGEVYALRTKDGAAIWHLVTGSPGPAVTVARDVVYVGSNNLYAVGAADGKQLWSLPESVKNLTTSSGMVYASTGTNLLALQA